MRFKQFLLEMPKINRNKMNPSTSFEEPKGRILSQKDNLDFRLTSEDNYSLSYILDKKVIGNIIFHNDDNLKGFVFISNVKVHSSYRSQGIATKMYEFIMSKFSGIVSGMSLTKDEESKQGSFYIWKKLEQKYKIYALEDEVLSKVSDIDDEKYVKVNVMFVASKKELTKKDVWGHITLNESISPTKPNKVETKTKIKDSGLWSKHKLRYKEFNTTKGTKVYVSFKDFGGNEECEINFETNESFEDKELDDKEVLKNVLYVVLREIDNKKYKNIKINARHSETGKNKHSRYDIFIRLIEKNFKNHSIENTYRSDFGSMDSILLRRKETINESYFEQLLENEDINNYVGKNGLDKKLTTFQKEMDKITIFENDGKKIVFGTDKNRIKENVEQNIDDLEEQIDFETKMYKKNLKDYNEGLVEYYDKIFEYKFLNEVDSFRKYLNGLMKAIVRNVLVIDILKKIYEEKK